jgi:hypothetical protein
VVIMTGFKKIGSNAGDAITGERIFPGETVLDTGIRNHATPFMRMSRNRVVKEETIVWLAEQAGYTLVKRDAGNSGNAKSVDAGDVESGVGEVEAGEAKAGGSKPAKRRSSGATKGK